MEKLISIQLVYWFILCIVYYGYYLVILLDDYYSQIETMEDVYTFLIPTYGWVKPIIDKLKELSDVSR